MAKKTAVNITDLVGLPDNQIDILRTVSTDISLELFSVPGGNVVVPLVDESVSDVPYTHVMNGKVRIIGSRLIHVILRFQVRVSV